VCADGPLSLRGNIAFGGQASWPMAWDATLGRFATACIAVDANPANDLVAAWYPLDTSLGYAIFSSVDCVTDVILNDAVRPLDWTCNPLHLHYDNTGSLFPSWLAVGVTDLYIDGGPSCGVVCVTCAPDQIPPVLPVTDNNGTWNAVWNGSAWATPSLCSANVANVGACTNCTTTSTAGALYRYLLTCYAAGQIKIVRQWFKPLATGAPCYQPCGCAPAIVAGFSSAIASVTCGSISWSGTLTADAGNTLADPVGGTVTFSQ
jgi:hypothetical protein